MDRLKAEFGDEITFIDLNIDDPAAREVMRDYGFRGRSEYALVDANGDIVRRWFGPLNEGEVVAGLLEFLVTQ